MSITDELREYAHDCCARVDDAIHDIADRIDAEHELEVAEAHAKGMREGFAADKGPRDFVELPKDANGEYIHVGDAVTCGATVWTVTGLKFLGEGWGICCTVYNERGGSGTSVYPPSDLRHYQPPTVEDVLREFAQEMNENMGLYTGEAIDADEWRDADAKTVEKYAAKLRLAESEDA